MSQLFAFADVRISLLEGWAHVTDDLPEGTPPTLAKPDGVGALQFSVAKYQAGASPNVSQDDLEALLVEFAESRALGPASDLERDQAASQRVGATFFKDDDLVRVWYLTNGQDVALVTYVGAETANPISSSELAEASAIVGSIDFD
ncbi:hypothetical protein ACSFBX_34860 [Variovorax sp. RB2P76]|uniref:hypothetical protein n=1 Tax=Variovorax sp. RB2P76 TaxID=3443736 RepID=UPI003F45D01C